MVMRLLPNGIKIGNATVIVDIVPLGNPEIRPGRKMKPLYQTDHDTGNSGFDANAEMHNRYIHNLASYHPRDTSHVSWHLTVDENFIYQHIPFDEIAWHCGDGTGPGNYSSVGVEKCMHRNGDRNKIEANGIALHAYLSKELNIPIANIRPHQAWSGKYCPQLILNKYGSFRPFRDKIEAALKGKPEVSQVSAKVHVVAKGETLGGIAKKYGASLTELTKSNNVKNPNFIYVGQRLVIPGSMVLPKPKPKPAPVKPAAPKTDSIVDYLNALGKPSSPSARAKLATQYGISGYKGTAQQNTLLLDRVRSGWKPAPKKTKEYVQLPKSAATWRTYKLNVQPVTENSDWSLTPARFGGLEYEVLGKPFPNVVTINTSRGKRNIYAAPSTGAKIVKK